VTEYLLFGFIAFVGSFKAGGGETPVEFSGFIGHLLKSLKKGGYTI